MGVAAGVRKYGAWPAFALGGTLVLEQGEHLSLSQAVDGLKDAFHASDRAIGGIGAAMTIVGALGGLPFGWLADRTRRTYLLAGAMALWTLSMGLSALAPGLVLLYLARLGVGVVEANGPAAVSLLADYYPVHERGRAMGRYQVGGLVGGFLGLGLGGYLVGAHGYRAAFWMWIPFGILVTWLVLRLPEPTRGAKDSHLAQDLHEAEGAGARFHLDLPAPTRTSTLDYDTATPRECLREVLAIRSMWFGAVSLTISQFFLAALGFWGIEFFKREYGLSAATAGLYTVPVGVGAALGVIFGGTLADRLLARGILQSRVLVPAIATLASTFTLAPAFLVHSLWAVAPFLLASGLLVTLPIAPSEALMTDVVPAPLRGRAASARSLVRSIAGTSPFLVGYISDRLDEDLGRAFLYTTPLLAIGGIIMFFAARTYPTDLAFVEAEAHRVDRAPDLTPVSHSEP